MSQISVIPLGAGGGTPVEFITGNSGGPVTSDGVNNINLLGSGDITVTGTPGTNTLTISSSGVVADSFATNSGTATPAAGILNIVGGTNMTTTGSGNTVTVVGTGAASFSWAVTTVNASAVAYRGYIVNKAGLLTMTLPASGAIGDIIEITGINTAVGWRIAQNANQRIHFGTSSSTIGVGGYIEATNIRDSARIVCVIAGASAEWNVISSVGNITIV